VHVCLVPAAGPGLTLPGPAADGVSLERSAAIKAGPRLALVNSYIAGIGSLPDADLNFLNSLGLKIKNLHL
jgi:hypothetical protein